METWKDVKGYEGVYQVSDSGNIKSLARLKFCGKNNVDGTLYSEKILKNNIGKQGYMRVNLWDKGKVKMHKVHTLVCEAFIPNPENKRTVNHKNGIKTDNRLVNLEWATHSENHKHAYKIGLKLPSWKGIFGGDHFMAKEVIQMDKLGNEIKVFGAIVEAANELNISFSCISSVCNGHQKTAGGFKWKFK